MKKSGRNIVETIAVKLISAALITESALMTASSDAREMETTSQEIMQTERTDERKSEGEAEKATGSIENNRFQNNENSKAYYIKLESRAYNTDFYTEAYGGVARVGTVIRGTHSTTIIEVGPQLLEFSSGQIRSIDAAVESYWSISSAIEAYGRWYPSYTDGYGTVDFYNTLAAGMVVRINGGVVDVNEYTGLASLSKGQYIKVEQDLSTFGGFNWSGNTTSARLGWAAKGANWTLAVEAGAAYANDLFKGERIRPSALFELYYNIGNDRSLILSYFPMTDSGFDGPIRGEFSLGLIQRF